MEALLRYGLRLWRRIAGEQTPAELALRRRYRYLKGRLQKKHVGPNFVTFWSAARQSRRVGIYAKGSCDLLSLFSCQPLIAPALRGSCCILLEGAVWDSTSSLILQGLQSFPEEVLAPVIGKLKLPPGYFHQGQMFERTMRVLTPEGVEEFPKRAVVMSVGPDLVRTLYRHREHRFLVDPGGWWFNQGLSSVLGDLSVARWFRAEFENVGRISVEAFAQNFERIVVLLRERTGARVLVYNALTVEPGSRQHNYQLVKGSIARRAREFDLCLVELSRKLDVAIVDIDRALKREGVSGQVDYAHFPPPLYPAVAREAFRVMREVQAL